MICPFCNNQAKWVENKEVYGKNYGKSFMMWLCKPCDAYVGCHNNTKQPLGTLANKETRKWRMKVHELLDPIWKNGKQSRGSVYRYITKELGLTKQYHTGEASIEDCKKVIKLLTNKKK